jgi:hypothetical protein
MAITKSWAGLSFNLPLNREPKSSNWGSEVSNFLIAIADQAIPKTGGLNTLTAELSFGPTYGIVSAYLKSVSANISTTGIVRFANNEGIGWRNATNTGDLILKVTPTPVVPDTTPANRLSFNGVLIPSADSTDILSGKSIDADTNTITNLETDNFKTGVIDTDVTLAANSDVRLATQKAAKAYTDSLAAYLSSVLTASSEPTGFVNLVDSTLTLTGSTDRKLEVTTATSYVYWIKGVKHTISTAKECQVTDTEGVWFFYFNAAEALLATQTFTAALVQDYAIVAFGYWDKTNSLWIIDADERHGTIMDGKTHAYLHLTRGASAQSLTTFTGFTITGATPTDYTSVQFYNLGGSIWDEDLFHSVNAETSAKGYALFYRQLVDGSVVYRRSNADTTNFINFINNGRAGYTASSNRIPYNKLVPTTGSDHFVEATSNGNVVLTHLFQTNDRTNPIIGIIGTAQYASVALATAGGAAEVTAIVAVGNLPIKEFVYLGSVLFQTSSAYSNSGRAKVVQTSAGGNYLVSTQFTTGSLSISAPNVHNVLSGRSDAGAHPGSAITNTPSGNLAATDVQGALDELQTDVDGRIPGLGTVVDNRLVKTYGTVGNTLEQTGITVDDSNNLTGVQTVGKAATSQLKIPSGTTAERTSGEVGDIRFNSSIGAFEGYGAAWASLGGGGLVVTPSSITTGAATTPLAVGKHYIFDMYGANADKTTALSAGVTESNIKVSVIRPSSLYKLTITCNGSEAITYGGTTATTLDIPAGCESWVEFCWNGTGWSAEDATTPVSGTWSGDMAITGTLTPSGGIVGKTSGVASATGHVGEMLPVARAGTGGSLYSAQSYTAHTSSFAEVASIELDKGNYWVGGATRAISNANANIKAQIHIGGSQVTDEFNTSIIAGLFGCVSLFYAVRITADNTKVAIYSKVDAGSISSSSSEMSAIRIV